MKKIFHAIMSRIRRAMAKNLDLKVRFQLKISYNRTRHFPFFFGCHSSESPAVNCEIFKGVVVGSYESGGGGSDTVYY